jgi:hypothetical protein
MELDVALYCTPGQQSVQELQQIADTIKRHAPCNLLVWGVGNDSALYDQLNIDGKTVFVEESQDWLNKMNGRVRSKSIIHKYCTTVENSLKIVTKSVVETDLHDLHWDIIIIDAPTGFSKKCPGRHVPISEAAISASQQKHISIFVHDVDRDLEKTLCAAHLENKYDLQKTAYDRTFKFEK